MPYPQRPATRASEPCLDKAVIGRHLVIQRCRLAGFRHHEAPALLPALRAGLPLTLSAERDNPYDGDAVAIHWQGHMLGYLPRGENLVVARLLARQRRLSARVGRLAPDADHNERVQIEILMH
jgi:hypothetical protein